MQKTFTRLFLFTLLCSFSLPLLYGQSVITQWNFNSAPPDGNTSTGTNLPVIGAGTITSVGGTTTGFNSGVGSTDAAAADNSGYQTTGYPAQSAADKTAGIRFSVSTAGYNNIIVSYDLRHSNASSRYEQLQYTTDLTATTPVWEDAQVFDGNGGDTWFNNRSFNFSAVTALNNNPNAGFRVVSTFASSTTGYAASNGGVYSGGTWRFDMLTVRGTSTSGGDVTAPVAQAYNFTSATASFIKFSEPVTTATTTNLANYSFNPSLTVSAATLSASGDTVYLTHAPFIDGRPYVLTVSGVQDAAANTMTSTNFNTIFNGSIPNLAITEIIHSPNDVEMIEVYNAGATAIPLGGLRWTDGTTGSFPVVSLAAGATAVFATAPTTASATLNVSPVYTILNGLGSTDDILVIRNSLNSVVDSVAYFVGNNGWPSAPTGVYAYSFELNAAANNNNNGANWFVPQNPVTPQTTTDPIRATPGAYPTPPYTPPTPVVSFTVNKVNVTEATTTVDIVVNLQSGNSSASTANLGLVSLSTAASGSDFNLPGSLQFSWPAFANNVTRTVTVTINNDVLPENTEYFTVRLTNPVNVSLPSASSNFFTAYIQDNDKAAPTATQSITLNHIASFSNGASGTNSAEIVAHDPASQRLFIANSVGAKLDIINFSNPSSATLISSISVAPYGNINSIAVKNSIVAAAIENVVPEQPGKVVFFDINGNFISQVNVGAMPDMILFDNAGTKVLTANEGQPRADYAVDPEGSVSIIDISGGVAGLTQAAVSTASFAPLNAQAASLRTAGVRIFGLNNPTVAQDMEPEYITLSADGNTAWVTCQENNAIAEINVVTSTITAIRALGTKDHSLPRNGLDANDQGGVVQIANWPVKGLYLPDAIASYTVGGQTYYVTANEGDAREYTAYEEATRLSASTYVLDPTVFPNADALKSAIGRLNVTMASGDLDNDGDYDEIHAFGSRSISIWNATTGGLVWDSGDELEEITSKHPIFGAIFNASNTLGAPQLKNRSDDKGPEPEGITIAQILGKTYAFVALERIGGCMVYDITNPAAPVYVDYKNTRNLAGGEDNGAEGIIYITAANSPTGSPIVILANEVSSTLSFFRVGSSNGFPLDIALHDIKAINVGKRNQVEWTTSDEQQGDVFELQRSGDGVRFTALATINANGAASSYRYWDDAPQAGINYYRLKLKHVSGSFDYSGIVSATVKGGQSFVSVYPNPVRNQLTIKLSASPSAAARVEIVNMAGVIVKGLKPVNAVQTIDVSGLPGGIYNLRYIDGDKKEVIGLTKQ
ncbi:MAG TPA: choice-of-anchor I family protein [Flavisolibacter sp.]|nr:choice-of-anchor I family protein [Flavisolibacter sp.]